jgi:hypothetical protein
VQTGVLRFAALDGERGTVRAAEAALGLATSAQLEPAAFTVLGLGSLACGYGLRAFYGTSVPRQRARM